MVKNIKIKFQGKDKERKALDLPGPNSRSIRTKVGFEGNDRLVLPPRNNSDTNIHTPNTRSNINPEKNDDINELEALINFSSKNVEYLKSLESYPKDNTSEFYFDAQKPEHNELEESIATNSYEPINMLRLNNDFNSSHLNSPHGKNTSRTQNYLQTDGKPKIQSGIQANRDDFIRNNFLSNNKNKNFETMPAPAYPHFYKDTRGIIS
ncbi:hypothetical protein AYI70_g4020 [Smittium culicis]|uniref:Uncharacterized protein n=1 Tax=Smittium culicis TaxID=133412 RepID=A0A1R1Y0Z3_9FUNG|nr:hypothetical protein AYI70_g4020 [Smittium culicis]